MRGLSTLIFLISLPLLVALGHDAYLYYDNQYNGDGTQEFMLSAVGFLWNRYDPESLNLMRSTVDPAYWDIFYRFILTQKAVVVGGVLTGLFCFVVLLLKIFKVGPFQDANVRIRSKNRKVDVILGDAKASGYKYKRK